VGRGERKGESESEILEKYSHFETKFGELHKNYCQIITFTYLVMERVRNKTIQVFSTL
jgi:hypothetical protein